MKTVYLAVISCLLITQSFANEFYPELMVTPKASERLKREAALEKRSHWQEFLPLQATGLTTLLAGITAHSDLDKDKDKDGIGPKLAMVVGGSWIAVSTWMQFSYRPYINGYRETAKLPYGSKREQLAAERYAEEKIDNAAALARKLKWLSFGTNLAASAYALSSAESDSTGQGVAAFGVLASAVPLLFPMKWEQVSEDQRSYKKKIFGPISFSNTMLLDPGTLRPVMGMGVFTTF